MTADVRKPAARKTAQRPAPPAPARAGGLEDMLARANKAELERWYPLKPHPVQLRLIEDAKRFKVVPAGRRSGKTERAKRYTVRAAMASPMPFFLGAPTYAQARRIFWDDTKLLAMVKTLPGVRVSESDLTILYPHGGSITVVGLDQPQRIEGTFWGGGVIDEVGDLKPEAWPENIRPALDTEDPRFPGYNPWCWLIGVPEGLNHYYTLAEYARISNDPDWGLYHWKSADILSADKIAAAKRSMSQRQFRQEYEASFETAAGRIYEDYSQANHTQRTIQPHDQLWWGHDFNFTPMSSFIGVREGDELYCLDEIVLDGAVARQSAIEFVDKFKDHANRKVIIFGDPAGRAGEKHGHASDYNEIESVLRDNGWDYERRVTPAAPAIRDRQNAVRAKIQTADGKVTLYVNPLTSPTLHQGLATLQTKKGSSFIEETTREQHITTALGYCVELEWPVMYYEPELGPAAHAVPPQLHFWNGAR